MRDFGQRKPIIVRREGMIVVAGNGTLEAARALGWPEVAAVIVDDDAVTATRFAIVDNRSAELAEWDDENLDQLLAGLMDAGASIPDLGFTMEEKASIDVPREERPKRERGEPGERVPKDATSGTDSVLIPDEAPKHATIWQELAEAGYDCAINLTAEHHPLVVRMVKAYNLAAITGAITTEPEHLKRLQRAAAELQEESNV